MVESPIVTICCTFIRALRNVRAQEKRFEKYHRVLNRAKWNSMMGAKILLGLLVALLPASFPILIVVDDTIERHHLSSATIHLSLGSTENEHVILKTEIINIHFIKNPTKKL